MNLFFHEPGRLNLMIRLIVSEIKKWISGMVLVTVIGIRIREKKGGETRRRLSSPKYETVIAGFRCFAWSTSQEGPGLVYIYILSVAAAVFC